MKLARWMLWTLGVLAALTAAVFALPVLYPVSSFIPELTRIASEKLAQPVAIGSLELSMLPTPRAVATGVTVGKKNDVTIGELEIVPELRSFLSGTRTIRLIRAEKVELKDSALAIPAAIPQGGAGEPVDVRRISLRHVKLHQPGMQLPEFDADASLGEGYRIERARLQFTGSEILLQIDPESPTAARFELKGTLYGGSVAGGGRIDWTKQWQLSGKAKLDRVDIVPLQQALGKKPKLSGKLKADASFSARARTPSLLADAMAVDGPFEVVGGAYQGYDLSKLGGFTGRLSAGGATRFEELKGRMHTRGKQVKLTAVCVRSPSLVAGGNIEIAPDQKLSGKLDVSVAKTGGFVGIPVRLSGTTADPTIMPSKGYLIGAAVGTVLLPGIGTSIGSSVGSRIEGRSECK